MPLFLSLPAKARSGCVKPAHDGLDVYFHAERCVKNPEVIPYVFEWNFEDGTKLYGMEAVKTFDRPGYQKVTLAIKGGGAIQHRVIGIMVRAKD